MAEAFRIHTFIATSPCILPPSCAALDEVIERAVYMVKRARNYTDDVEFSCEDAGRTPIEDLARVVEAAINAGAKTINIPDTVGYTMPFEFSNIITGLYDRVPNIDKAIISVHTHDDLGGRRQRHRRCSRRCPSGRRCDERYRGTRRQLFRKK